MNSETPARGRAARRETVNRTADLRRMLSERRRAMQDEMYSRILDGRTERPTDVRDELEQSDAHGRGYIELALLQIRADTVSRVDEALARLDAGTYGVCVECASEISEPRLHAVPFAVRCQACEGKSEEAQARARHPGQRRGNLLQFPGADNS